MRVLNQIACTALIGLYLVVMPMSAADFYKLSGVKRVDTDLYRADGGLIIETQFCLHLTIGEDAVLKWNGAYSMDNKIVWDDNSSCDVKKLVK